MKNKITILLTLFFSFCFVNNVFATETNKTQWNKVWTEEINCDFATADDTDTVSRCLSKYKSSNLVWTATSSTWDTNTKDGKTISESDNVNNEYTLEWWFKTQVDTLLWNVWLLLWIIAVWAIVYAWLMLQFSGWNDEKIKKSKNIIKWALIWFAAMMLAWAIIVTVVDLMYWFF